MTDTPRAVIPCDPAQAKSVSLTCSAGASGLDLAISILQLLAQYDGRAMRVEISEVEE